MRLEAPQHEFKEVGESVSRVGIKEGETGWVITPKFALPFLARKRIVTHKFDYHIFSREIHGARISD